MMNERYDYREAVKNDAVEVIKDTSDLEKAKAILSLFEDENEIYDGLFIDDAVTGNASGSYTFNTWQAEENLCHNLDLLGEALEEFGSNLDIMKNGPEACDVTIRCYLLGQVIGEAIDEAARDALKELICHDVNAAEMIAGVDIEGFAEWGEVSEYAAELIDEADREKLVEWLETIAETEEA